MKAHISLNRVLVVQDTQSYCHYLSMQDMIITKLEVQIILYIHMYNYFSLLIDVLKLRW